MLRYKLCFLQCDWQREHSPQKVISVNEAQGISQTSPDSLLLRVGSGHETSSTSACPFSALTYLLTSLQQITMYTKRKGDTTFLFVSLFACLFNIYNFVYCFVYVLSFSLKAVWQWTGSKAYKSGTSLKPEKWFGRSLLLK